MATVKRFLISSSIWFLCVLSVTPVLAQSDVRPPAQWRGALADYDAEPRRLDGRVDVDTLVMRLKELGVTTYYWLVWHASTDWEDLKLFLPKAAEAGLDVWVYLVPPTESVPHTKLYSEPFRLDYHRWAEEIARLSLLHSNLTGWVIDDFYANQALFTPAYVREMRMRARKINPRLAFYPLMYFGQIRRSFVNDYHDAIDGVVVAYPEDRDEINEARDVLNDSFVTPPGELSYPWGTPSKAGDFVMASQSVTVVSADRYVVRFRERDDFTGSTAGYHFKQLLVDGAVAWEEDVAGGTNAWHEVTADITVLAKGKSSVTVSFRLMDKKGVSKFGVRWRVRDLLADGLQFHADLTKPQQWTTSQRGAFETGFGSVTKQPERRFHVPFIVMTSGDVGTFRKFHGDPASPERVAEWLRMSLDAWRDGKCEGVVTYCLDKRPKSRTFELARDAFRIKR